MSEKRFTKDEPDLPYDDYTVVARLFPFLDQPYGQKEAIAVVEALQLRPTDVEVLEDQLFVRLRVGRIAGEKVIANEIAFVLHQGLAGVSIDPDISAGIDTTAEVGRHVSLVSAFRARTTDITEAVDHELRNLEGEPVQTFNFDIELQQLLDH